MTRTDKSWLFRPRTLLGLLCLAPVVGAVLALGCSPTAGIAAGGSLTLDTSAVSVTIIPSAATVAVGGTQLFRASGLSPTGTLVAPAVTYFATGGTISGIGLYTAPALAGLYSVVATKAGGTLADTATVSVTAAAVDTTPVSIAISPKASTLVTGGSRTFVVTGRSSSGAVVVPAVSFFATGGLVSPAGVYTAPGVTGTFKVIAAQTVGTLADTATVTVVSSGPATPWVLDDFSTYATTSALIANGKGTFRGSTSDTNVPQISLDLADGVGAPLGSDRSMKYTFPDQTANPNRCIADFTVTRVLKVPAPVTELWLEVWIKFSANWNTNTISAWGCGTPGIPGNTPDYKLLFIGNNPAGGRWQIKAGTYSTPYWNPNHSGGTADTFITQNVGNGGMWWDGTWHRVRWHAKISTTTSSGDGDFDWWLDSVKMPYPAGISTAAGLGGPAIVNLTDIVLGANLNRGPSQTQTISWGAIRLYNADPGW